MDEALGKFTRRLVASLFPKIIRERFQTPFDGDGSFRLSLRPVRKIQIFKLALAEASENFRPQFVRELFLFLDGIQDRAAPRFEFGIVLPQLVDVSDLDVV